MKLKSFALVLLVAAGAACRSSQAPQTASDDIPRLAFEKFELDNGLEVILSEDHRLPLVSVNLWYHVGPVNEEAGRTGFAHLFEHMMFQGSKHVPGDSHFRLLEGAGASDINGTTDFDRTNYFATVPANQLELALWLESDRMGYLLDVVDQAKLSNQQDVVRNERRQSVENQPYGVVSEAVYQTLFPETHPYYASVIGSHTDIQAAKLEDVRNFFELYYAPNNASVAIVGDFDPVEARALVEKYFGSLERGEPVPQIEVETPPVTSERRVVVRDRVELPRVYMAWITSPIFQEGDADADVASMVLGGGRSSRLYKSLVYEQQIAQDVSAFQESLVLGSVFWIEATARPGHTAEELEAALDAELDRLREAGPEPVEIDQARNTLETRIVQRLETLGGFGGVADRLNSYNHYLGTPDYLAQDIARYRNVSPDSVQAFVRQQLRPDARAVVYGVPGEPEVGPEVPTPAAPPSPQAVTEAVNTDEPWRSDPPEPGPAVALQLPAPASFTLDNGLTVLLNERPGLPVVSVGLVFKTGSDANPVDRPGLANFVAAMLDEGTEARSALELADEVARLGGSLSTSSTMDIVEVTASSLTRTFPSMLELVADVALHPAFPADEIERQRASRLASLVQQRENPNTAANAAMFAALYGPEHAYGYLELGTEASNQAIGQDDLRGFWSQNFVPNNAALIVSGQITADELRPLVDASFGAWQPGTPAQPSLGEPRTTGARLVFVDKPGAPQTQVRVASLGVPRSTPDYEALVVMNEALGGLFSSRINLNLREEHGYTYGAGSQFVMRRSAGPFLIASGVRTDVTGPAVDEMFKEVRRMRDTSLTPEELSLAKDSLIRSLPSQFETSLRVSRSTSALFVYDLGLDYFTQYPARLAAVTADAVQAVAGRYLLPDNLVVIAVGDRTAIEPGLRRLNLGRAEVRNSDGILITTAASR